MYSTRLPRSGLILAFLLLHLLIATGAAQSIAAPQFNPAAGDYYTYGNIAVTCATAGATIYYTLDGNAPVSNSLTLSSGGTILVDHSLKLKAAAWLGGHWSEITTAEYAITGQIAAGAYHAYVLPSSTVSVLAFGDNSSGQLGIGTSGSGVISTSPVAVKADSATTLNNIVAVAAGSSHSLLLKSDRSVLASGANADGQLGVNYPSASSFPVAVGGLSGVAIDNIASGGFHNLLLDSTGRVWAFGRNSSGQGGNGGVVSPQSVPAKVKINATTELSGVIQVAAGLSHSVALVSNGTSNTLYAWGSGTSGQLLGNGLSTSKSFATPSPVINISSVACGDNFTLAVKNDGTLWGWGTNTAGQLGNGATTTALSAVQVLKKSDGTALTGIVGAEGGISHSLALASDGTVWAFGDNTYGQLGTGTSGTGQKETKAVQVLLSPGRPLKGIVAVAAGSYFSMALSTNGLVYVWGQNSKGQLGNGTSGSTAVAYPVAYNKLPPMSPAAITTQIANPIGGQILTEAPATVLSALITRASNAPPIARVEFYSSGLLLGSSTAPPYSFNWTPPAPGTYSISATAVDTAGGEWPSQSVSCTVLPVVSLQAPSPATIGEDSADGATINVTRTSAVATPLTLTFNLTGTASNGTDYQKLTGSVVIAAGATSAPIQIKPLADTIFELSEIATVTLRTAATYVIAGTPQTVTILDRLPVLDGVRARFQADAGITADATNRVSSWTDQSGTGTSAVQSTQALQPLLVAGAVSGRPIVRFNGSSNFLQAAGFNLFGASQEFTTFVVAKPKSTQLADAALLDYNPGTGSGFAIHQAGSVTNRFTAGETPSINLKSTVFQLYSATQSALLQSAYVNGVLMARGSASFLGGAASPGAVAIGGKINAASARYFNGDIAEIIVYNRSLSEVERRQIGLYLGTKYSPISTNPPSPSGVVATAISASQIHLGWTSSNSTISSFKVERRIGTAGAYVQIAEVPGWQKSIIDSGLSPSATYFYRVTAMALNRASAVPFYPASALTLPNEAAMPIDPSVWFSGDTGVLPDFMDATRITQWLNMGSDPVGYAEQPAKPSEPQILAASELTNRPVIRFNGTSNYLQTVPFNLRASSPDLTLFVVTQAEVAQSASANILDYDNSTNAGLAIERNNANSYSVGSGSISLNPSVLQIAAYSRNGPLETLSVDGVNQYSGTGSNAPIAALRALALGGKVSGPASRFFKGDIAEVLIYNRALSAAESDAITRYLGRKYLPGAMDLDGDGLTNEQEASLYTDPLNWDTNGDGFSDSEDIARGYDPAETDLDYDGISNAQEILDGTNPFDFYNGVAPVLAILTGNEQTGAPQTILPVPLTVTIKDAAGEPVAWAPVTFQVASGGGMLADPEDPETFYSSITVWASETGEASALFQMPIGAEFSSVIHAFPKGPANASGVDFTELNSGAMLTFTPAAGRYDSPISVTINTLVLSAIIHYTVDGTDPTISSPELPSAGLRLSHSARLNVRAFEGSKVVSGVSSALYLIGSLISAGDDTNFVPGIVGLSYSWGSNSLGQLGDGTRSTRWAPNGISVPTIVDSVAGGAEFAVALDRTGALVSWGDNYFGQLGNNTTVDQLTPIPIVSARSYQLIVAGKDHAMAVAIDGTVWSWGNNSCGQLGDGTLAGKASPTQVTGLSGIVKIATGTDISLAVGQDGKLWGWGSNQFRQLGDASPDTVSSPISLPMGEELVQAVSAGASHVLVLTQSGKVYACGGNWHGQLGNGTTTETSVPSEIFGLPEIIAVSAGKYHSIAVARNGTVYSWGANWSGQLGDGSFVDRSVPNVVVLPGQAIAIAAGLSHSAVVLADGRIFTFGDNSHGQLGLFGSGAVAVPSELSSFRLFLP